MSPWESDDILLFFLIESNRLFELTDGFTVISRLAEFLLRNSSEVVEEDPVELLLQRLVIGGSGVGSDNWHSFVLAEDCPPKRSLDGMWRAGNEIVGVGDGQRLSMINADYHLYFRVDVDEVEMR